MNKDEIHNIVKEQQPNICQVVAYKDNKIELSVQAMSIWKVIMMWVIPIIITIISIFIWLRRRGR